MNTYQVFDYLKLKNKIKQYTFFSATSQGKNNKPSNVINGKNETHYHSLSLPNQSLRIDFPISQVYIEKFRIKTSINRDPYHWLLEGSTDAVNFIELYDNDGIPLCDSWGKFDNVNTGCTEKVWKEFNVTKPDYYTSIKIRQTGLDSNNETYLVISGLEFIGRIHLYEPTYINIIFIRNPFIISLFSCLLY